MKSLVYSVLKFVAKYLSLAEERERRSVVGGRMYFCISSEVVQDGNIITVVVKCQVC